jgi:hypothetical protein
VTAEQALQAAANLCRQKAEEWTAQGLDARSLMRAQVAYLLAGMIARLDLSPASVSSVNLRPDGAGAGICGEELKR